MDKEETQDLTEHGVNNAKPGSAGPRHESRNVGANERLASLIGGSVVLFLGLRRGGMRNLLLTALGGVLVYRGATGYCQINQRLGRTLDRGRRRSREAGTSASITIGRDPETLYRFWRDVENLPSVMSFITEVTALDQRRSRWVAHMPYGGRMEWEAEITDDRPNEAIGWRSRDGQPVHYQGMIHFHPAPGDRGTEVTLDVSYQPPGGALGAKLSHPATALFKQKLREDLRRFKQRIEAGEMPTARSTPRQPSQSAPPPAAQ